MPNWVVNKIEFSGKQENIDKVLSVIKGDEECIDFNKLVPMPESLNIASSSDNDFGIVYYISNRLTIPYDELDNTYLRYVSNMFNPSWARTIYEERLPQRKEDFDKLYEMGKTCCENIKNYGHKTWYEWCNANWGTKWNSRDSCMETDDIMTFDTAWGAPLPVLDKLAELCYKHDVEFTGKWADEDAGHNVGIFESDCNRDEYWFSYEYMENGSNEAYEIYMDLHDYNNCIGKDEEGNWTHYDCDDCPNKEYC